MEHKIKKTLARDELSRYLHTLADAVQTTGAVYDPPFSLLQSAFDKLEFKCKREAERFEIKLKLKTNAKEERSIEGVDASPAATPGAYKALKKRMQATFKRLGAMIADNRTPDDLLIQTFQTEVLEMIRYPDRGEPHYDAFVAACRRLTEACQSNRMDEMRQAFDALSRMKKDCHTRYK